MDFVTNPTRYLFFTGKGGVGKTSIACATAVTLADRGLRVLLVSTDPASNLDDVFSIRLSNAPTPIPGVAGLCAVNVDPEAAAKAYRDRVVGPYRGVLPDDAVAHMEEQLSGSCTVEIAAFDEFTALLTNSEIAAGYDHIVFDTAPTGHTLRLLALPAAWTGFLNSNSHGSSCLGPLSGMNSQKDRYEQSVAALGDPLQTSLIMVARADVSALREADRSSTELAALGLKNQRLVVNGVLTPASPGDEMADAMARRALSALAQMPLMLGTLPRFTIPLKPMNIVGLEAVRSLFKPTEPLPPGSTVAVEAIDLPGLSGLIAELEKSGHGVIMTMGKGGVGKTTIAAAIAVELAHRGHQVHLTTTDPAAHVTATLNAIVPNLRVDRIDPVAETRAYREGVLAKAAQDLDAAGLALLEEDLRSPCTEEVAVFRAFSNALSEATRQFVVIDTAPTGHTLLLVDATGSYHREMMRQMAVGNPAEPIDHGIVRGVSTPLMKLQDPEYTKVLIVTLAETTPVLEASQLQNDLRRAKIEPFAWVINGALSAAGTTDPLLRVRAASERDVIAKVTGGLAARTHMVPWQVEQPVGAAALGHLVYAGLSSSMP